MPYTTYIRALVPCTSWWPSARQPATEGAAWDLAALGAALWAGFEPCTRLRLALRCRRVLHGWLLHGWLLHLRWCTPRAFTQKALATHVSRFARL